MSKNNSIKRTVYGIGYNQKVEGEKYYEANTKIYKTWHNMMQRCYDYEYKKRKPSYHGAYVKPEWHNFQNFAKWYEENYYKIDGEVMELDKDLFSSNNESLHIFAKDNKTCHTNGAYYSPDTCCFLPRRLNLLFRTRIQELGSDKIENIYLTPNGKYEVRLNNGNGEQIDLGVFDNERSAWLAYKLNKEIVIQTITEEYKGRLPKHIYDKLMKYEIEDPEKSTMAIFNNCFKI